MKNIIKFSKYPSAKSKDKIDIDIQDYIEIVQKGTYQDLVLKARAVKSAFSLVIRGVVTFKSSKHSKRSCIRQ